MHKKQLHNAEDLGHLFLRVCIGGMIFYIHGLHKLEGWVEYLQHGTPWPLLKDVMVLHAPFPYYSAILATFVQFICSIFIVFGLFTRVNAFLLTGALSGAILENLMAGRDPQLAILYTLSVVAILIMGGGKYSLDARNSSKI